MKLSKLLHPIYDATIYADADITGLAIDSRKVKPGDLFFAYKGTSLDGRQFINDAIRNGARAILTDTDSEFEPAHNHNNVAVFPIDHLSTRIGQIAAEFYGHPAKKLKIAGVTGTNGKTSFAYFLADALQQQGVTCGVIGTLGSGLYGNIEPGSLTTPDAVSLQSTFYDFVHQKAKAVAMEVSSHSIDQGRINEIEFEVGVFTNLSRDHLDYHGTMEAYGAVKRKLFADIPCKHAVINADDEFGRELLANLHRKNLYAYSLDKKLAKQYDNLVVADHIKLSITGIEATVYSPWGEGKLVVPLIGLFNLSNVLAVLTTLCLYDIPFDQALNSLAQLAPVPGRMQAFGGGKAPLVVVDYSHTPDALEKALTALRKHCTGKLFCLFGCGGDRDRGKRPLMAAIAEQHADFVMVTDDNPRTEEPAEIVADIMAGFTRPDKVIIEHDRSKAIRDIIQCAGVHDCILVAGKGAELYQQIGAEKIPFSDIEKVKENLP